MTDVFTPEKRSAVMRRVKSTDTSPERTVRRLLTRMGVGYRLHRKDLPGKPDIVMAGRKLAIFVHGCFWHGHDCARGARMPKANRPYWEAKIGRNRARDETHRAALEAMGWRVVVLWECGLKDEPELNRALRQALALPLDGGGLGGGVPDRLADRAREAAAPLEPHSAGSAAHPHPGLPPSRGKEGGLA